MVKIIKKLLLVLNLLILNSCVQLGWDGRYEQKAPVKYAYKEQMEKGVIKPNYTNTIIIPLESGGREFYLGLPDKLGGFLMSGIGVPILPGFWLKSWNKGGFYVLSRKESGVKIYLKHKGKIYSSNGSNCLYPEAFCFPVPIKNIDKGSVIIEKDDFKTEILFEYRLVKYIFLR